MGARGGITGEDNDTFGRPDIYHASAVGSWRSFWPSNPSLESQDGALYLWRAQQYPHHRFDFVQMKGFRYTPLNFAPLIEAGFEAPLVLRDWMKEYGGHDR